MTGCSYVPAVDHNPLWRHGVGEALLRAAHTWPNGRALVWLTDTGSAALTWPELVQSAHRVAAGLAAVDTGRNRVALVGQNSADWIVAMFGCALAGFAVVPVSPGATAAEARHVLEVASIGVVLVSDDDVASTIRRAAQGLRDKPAVRPISGPNGVVEPNNEVGGAADDEFLVQFTSGTTGAPKAASLTHLAALNSARFFAEGVGAEAGDVWFNPLPLFHIGGLVSGVLSCLAVGATYVVVERFTATTALRVLRELRPALLGVVPTMMTDLLDEPTAISSDFASVRTVIGGASDVYPQLAAELEDRLGVQFQVGYGQSESPCMAMSLNNDNTVVRVASLGHPLPGRDYYIADRSGVVVATGEVGELCVRGPLNMSGYLCPDGGVDSDADDSGWRRTGDLCALDDDGVLTFAGRVRDVIIRGGENIYPAELEQALSELPMVSEVAVFGVPDERLGQRVVAALVPMVGEEMDVAAVSSAAAQRLERRKRPEEWLVVDELPRTSTGKVRKHQLTQRYVDGSLRSR